MTQHIYCISPEVIADAIDEAIKTNMDIGQWTKKSLYDHLLSRCWNPSAVNISSVMNLLYECRSHKMAKGCDSGLDLISRRMKEKRFTL